MSKAAVGSMKILHPRLFERKYMFEMETPGFGCVIKGCRPIVRLSGTRNEGRGTTRPNGWDRPVWDDEEE